MTAAPRHPDLHQLVERLNPAQAEAVRAVVFQLVTSDSSAESERDAETLPRNLAFVGMLQAEPDFAERSEEILDEIIRRDAG